MKFLCVDCDERMSFVDRRVPGDGTLAAVFRCPACGRSTAMLANPMETSLVSSLGVEVGGRTVPEQPLEMVRSGVASGREDAFADDPPEPAADPPEPAEPAEAAAPAGGPAPRVVWSAEAVERLARVPRFVRGMVKRIYTDWAKERGIGEITPDVMDRARTDLGLEGM